MLHFVATISSDALQTADRDGFAVHTPTATRWLTRPIASAAQDSGEYVRLAVEEIRISVSALGDQTDVFGNIGVSGTSPLTVHYFVEVVRIASICRLHNAENILYPFERLWAKACNLSGGFRCPSPSVSGASLFPADDACPWAPACEAIKRSGMPASPLG